MDPIALGAAASLAITVLVAALALGGLGAGAQVRNRLEGVLSGSIGTIDSGSPIDPLRGKNPAGMFQFIMSGAFLARIERDLHMADSQLKPVDFIAIRVALAVLLLAVPYLFFGGAVGILVGAGVALVGFQLPQMWVKQRAKSRASSLEQQLPEALTQIGNSLKAGFGLIQSLSLAADQLAHPISTELAQTVHETNVGSSMDEAFVQLSERCESYDLDLVVTAILVQRSAGGNLSEILGNVADTMRERVRIRGEIQTLTAQQRMTGFVIGLLPVAVGGLFFVVSPEYVEVLLTETLGNVMLGAAVLLEAVGLIIIRRILAIEV
ncbi:MAG: type II secretion system F family protein [Dehalococcoidia bacterium]